MDESEIERGILTERMVLASRLGRIQREFEPRLGPSVPDCEDCGEDIPAGRREALPNARRCVECQAIWESGR